MFITNCSTCKHSIKKEDINIETMVYYCPQCKSFQKISAKESAKSFKASIKTKVEKPDHFKTERTLTEASITIRSGKKNLILSGFMLIPFVIMMLAFTSMVNTMDIWSLLIIGVMLIGFLHYTLTTLLKRKRVLIYQKMISYQEKPYYKSKYKTNYQSDIDGVTQCYVRSRKVTSGDNNESTVYDLIVKSNQAEEKVMIQSMSSQSDAIFIEQFIEDYLGIVDEIQDDEASNIRASLPSISEVIKAIRKS